MSKMEVIDGKSKKQKHSSTFKTMTILSFIGNGIWALLFLLLFIACIVNGATIIKSVSLDGFFGGAIVFFTLLSAVILGICLTALIGVIKMRKGKRQGFALYAIANGLWSLLLFYAGTDNGGTLFWIAGIISLLFIGYYALRLPKMH